MCDICLKSTCNWYCLCEPSCQIDLPLIVDTSACDVLMPVGASAPNHEFGYICILAPFIRPDP